MGVMLRLLVCIIRNHKQIPYPEIAAYLEVVQNQVIANYISYRIIGVFVMSVELLFRYHRKKERLRGELEEGEEGDDGEELLSEYSPSELSAILAAEDAQREGGQESETSSEGGDDDYSEEDDERGETKEEMLKR